MAFDETFNTGITSESSGVPESKGATEWDVGTSKSSSCAGQLVLTIWSEGRLVGA